MKIRVFAFVLLMSSMVCRAQGIGPGAILVGEKVPLTELKNVINYPSKTLRFADHKPKVTILDFWSTNCKGCIAAWPKMLGLQKEFGSDLQIILVDMLENETVVKDFLAHRRKISGVDMNLPISCRDSATWKPFNRYAVPRYYWIDSNGMLASVTHTDQVTSANIRKWINSGPFKLEQIIEEMFSVRGNKPIFVDGNGGDGKANLFIWSSTLTKGAPDIRGSAEEFVDPIQGYGFISTGADIRGLYSIAYNKYLASDDYFTFMHSTRISVDAVDTSKYYRRINGVDNLARSYNYQLISGRPTNRRELQKTMREDLDRYFQLDATWEKRKKKALVLSMFDSTKAKALSQGWALEVSDLLVELDSVTVHEVIYIMEQTSFFFDKRQIVDETGYKGLLTGVRFKENCYDLKAFDKALSKFGMHIKEEVRDVEVLILRERKASN